VTKMITRKLQLYYEGGRTYFFLSQNLTAFERPCYDDQNR
jgi:hypothetical protein